MEEEGAVEDIHSADSIKKQEDGDDEVFVPQDPLHASIHLLMTQMDSVIQRYPQGRKGAFEFYENFDVYVYEAVLELIDSVNASESVSDEERNHLFEDIIQVMLKMFPTLDIGGSQNK
jgi:purine-nucleoside phosphorylase